MADALLGKLRALAYDMKIYEDGSRTAVAAERAVMTLAGLLPQIIAQIDRDAKDAARLDSRAIRIDNPKHNPPFSVLHRNIDLRAAIDAAKDPT